MMPPPVTVGGSSIVLLTAAVHGPGAICVAILRCSGAPLLGVALLRLRCLSSLDEGSLPSRLVSLATRPRTAVVVWVTNGPLPLDATRSEANLGSNLVD